MVSNLRAQYSEALEENPGISIRGLARLFNRDPGTVYNNLARFGLGLESRKKFRQPTNLTFIGDLFRDMEDAGINFRTSTIPYTTINLYRIGRVMPTLGRLEELQKLAKSRVVTTGRIRARLESLRASTNDLEMLSACAIMADIISEIEDE